MSEPLSQKGLTSHIVFISFLIMTVTGIVLYFEPQGRVAYWTEWRFLGLTKPGWDHVHVTSSVLFALAAAWHLVLNWRVYVSYITRKVGEAVSLRSEAAIAIAVGLVLVVGTILEMPPFAQMVGLSEKLKQSWVRSPEQEPPYGHAELSKLKHLARRTGMDAGAAVIALRERGIDVTGPDQTILEIARTNGISPMEVYGFISYLVPKEDAPLRWTPEEVEERFEGTGIGSKVLRNVLIDAGVAEADWIRRLASANIKAMSDETVREAAKRNGVRPIEILKAALIDGYKPEKE